MNSPWSACLCFHKKKNSRLPAAFAGEMGDRWQAVLSHTPATYTACRPVDSRWHPVIQQVGYPAPLFDHIVHARVQQAAALLPQATRVRNAMTVHGSMISNRDKDDVREPLRYALDIHKFEKQAKREANDSRNIIPLPRGLAGIPQHNHKLTGSNPRRAGVIAQKGRDKIWTSRVSFTTSI